ncbi:MAG: tyrosine-type recombinase/integrase [Spirochaetaceae bacterium]|jgi:integrase|nr:tyrosine-type recombinase/integrase [Spirochaetaceae bacterium]
MKPQTKRQFYLHRRRFLFYVQFTDPDTRRRLSALSTGKTTRDDALLVVYDWIKNGIPEKRARSIEEKRRGLPEKLAVEQLLASLKEAELTESDVVKIEKILRDKGLATLIVRKDTPQAELFTDYLTRFWDYDKSPYVEEKHSHKLNITRKHTLESLERVNRYWVPYFKGKTITEVTRQNLKDFSLDVTKKNPALSPLTLKQILRVGVTALRWAYANEIIPIDPTIRLPAYSSKSKKRGVLTPEEAMALFRLPWNDARYFLANLVAMTTGLRVAEILALRMEDVGEKYLAVDRSFSLVDGLKMTKTEEPRTVPIVPQIRDALRRLGDINPHGDGFIFYSDKPGKPLDQHEPLKALKKMLVRMKIGDNWLECTRDDTREERDQKREVMKPLIQEAREYWKKRNVVFHSWRHFFSKNLADNIEIRKVMLATGHKTEAVFRNYADHIYESDLKEVAAAADKVFQPILPCKNGELEQIIQEPRFEREKLYEEVWAEPVTVVAARYGITDTGLRKVCRRLNVPHPPPGYWAKVKAGKAVEKPELPE